MRVRFSRCWIIVLFVLVIMGCAPVISKPLRDQVDRTLTFRDVFHDPEGNKGKMVIWAGVIVEARNTKEGTLIEVLRKPADYFGGPEEVDQSEGRFLALYGSYLDIAVYAKGREVTVAGEVTGKRILPLGEIQYTYPLLFVKEIYLWPEVGKERLAPYPYAAYYPWWWYDPYWTPWYSPYPYGRYYRRH